MGTLDTIGYCLNDKKNHSLKHISKTLEQEKEVALYWVLLYVEKKLEMYTKTRYQKRNEDINRALQIMQGFDFKKIEDLEPYQISLFHIQKYSKSLQKKNSKYYYYLETIYIICQDILDTITPILLEREQNRLYNYMYEIIFEIKNIYFLQNTFTQNRYIASHTKEILPLVMVEYGKAIQLEQKKELIYYEEVIDLYYQYLSREERETCKEQLRLEFGRIKQEIEDVSPFIENLLNTLEQQLFPKDEVDLEQNIQHLNHKYGFSATFSGEALLKMQKEIKRQGKKYLDCRDLYTISIDEERASLYEDAFSLEKLKNGNYILGVYISDIATLVPLDSTLSQEMSIRLKNIYLPDRVYEITPKPLRDYLSLQEQVPRYAIGHFFEFSASFELLHFEIKNTLIKVNQHFTFKEVDEMQREELKNMKQVLEFLQNINLKDTTIESYHQIKEWVREIKGIPNPYPKTNASVLISKAMILTNYSVASYFWQEKLPFLYRNNEWVKNSTEFNRIKQKYQCSSELDRVLNSLEKSYSPSTYSHQNKGHAGLNLSAYGHTTCPVRNYAAFLSQHLEQLFYIDRENITDRDVYYYEDLVRRQAQSMNQRNMDMVQYQKEFCKLYNQHKK